MTQMTADKQNTDFETRIIINIKMKCSRLKILLMVALLLFVCNINAASEDNVFIKRLSSNESISVSFWKPSAFGDNRILSRQFISHQSNDSAMTFNLASPKVYEVAPFYSTFRSIYMTPGDSVAYCVKQDESKNGEYNKYYLEFYGKNAAHYNYDILRNKELQWTSYKKGDSLEEYKRTLLAQYNAHMNFLSDYIQKHSVSDGFIHWAEADIKNEYIFRLYLPFSLGDATINEIPENYFSDAKIIDNDLAKYYSSAIQSYIQFYTPDIFSHFKKVYTDFIKNESGKHRAYLLSSTIGIFAEKQNRSYFNELLQAIDKAHTYVKDSAYLDFINKSKKFYLSVNEQFPDSVLLNSFLIPYEKKDTMSLKEVLEMYKDKALYIDFWASWCGPCRRDISQSQLTKNYLDAKQIEYLYISIDNKEKDWITSTNEEKITHNQYLLCDIKNSPLLNYLKMSYIPRYLLLNSKHKIKDFAAPSSSVENLDALKESIKANFEQNQIHTTNY